MQAFFKWGFPAIPSTDIILAPAGEEGQAEDDLLSSAAQTWARADSKWELTFRERATERPVYVSRGSYRTESDISKHAILEFFEHSPWIYLMGIYYNASKLFRSSKDTECQQTASKKVIPLKVWW